MALEHIELRAARIRQRREELGLTQEDVAERMQEIHAKRHPGDEPDHTRGQMVSDWERAVNEPSPRKLELLAAALDWTVGDLSSDHEALSGDLAELDVEAPLADQLSRIEVNQGLILRILAEHLAEDLEPELDAEIQRALRAALQPSPASDESKLADG